eukprot:TRINITY_DN8359_c0_g1_i1.p1 TRINITY_DN8359_c0_g1~~TRINITY_DN8359_c0_g1_i1.p1  ORF type:complete len:467 (-),score=85.74 TRINITY_DN8359_c0_g1_i1:84-1484(-)
MSSYDAIIVGAGIAGSALASVLGKDERKVLLIERDWSEPDRIVGELLQPGGINALKKLGLEDCVENIDSPEVYGYAVVSNNETIPLTYPTQDDGSVPIGHSFHHGRFVQNLRAHAKKYKTVTPLKGSVTRLIESSDESDRIIGVEYKDENQETQKVYAKLTIVCDGCGSRFRKDFIPQQPITASRFVGIVLEGCKLPVPNHGHVFLLDPSPVLAYQIGSNETRVLVDVPQTLSKLAGEELVKFLKEHTAPQLPEQVRIPFLTAIAKSKYKSMPNSKLHPQPFFCKGMLLLGDAYNMRHPLTGAGMTVALSDVVILRDEIGKVKDLSDDGEMKAMMKEWYKRRWPLATTSNILAHALYSLFAARTPALVPMRAACMQYFKLGGECANGPMNLLAVTKPQPFILIRHFFQVALYGMYLLLLPIPYPWKIWEALAVLYAACVVVLPLMYNEHVFSFSYPQLPQPKPKNK